MIEINLIPDVKQELLRAQRTRAVVISGAIITSIIAAGIVVLMLVYIYGVQGVRHGIYDRDIEDRSAKLAQVEDLSKMLTIQNQLSKMSELSNGKKLDSRLFDMLQAVLPPEPNSVKISQVSVNSEDSTITLEGQTATFESMEVFKKTLQSAIITYTSDGETEEVNLVSSLDSGDVTFGSNSDNQKVVVFSVTFEHPEELFSAKNPVIGIKLSIDGNVTDSYLGVPRSIFTEKAKEIED